MMRDQKVGVGARWRTSLQPKFLESDGALWNARRVLHHNDIASHQIGGGKAGELVVGKVPRLDAEEHAEGDTFDLSFARARLEGFGTDSFLCPLFRTSILHRAVLAKGIVPGKSLFQ